MSHQNRQAACCVVALACLALFGCPADPPSVGDAPAPPGPGGETCAEATAVSAGGLVFGDLTASRDDVAPSCAADVGLPDRVYAIDIAEQSTLRVRLDPGATAAAVAVFSSDACGADEELACADLGLGVEIVTAEVEAGRTYVVVDGAVDVTFSLRIEVLPGACVGDALDLVDPSLSFTRFIGAADGTDSDVDTNFTQAGVQPAPLHLCPADVDGFVLAHLGGPLVVDVYENSRGEGVVHATLQPLEIDAERTSIIAFIPQVTRRLPPISLEAAATNAAPGHYLLRVSEDGAAPNDPRGYNFTVSHGCQGDPFDSPDAFLEDATSSRDILIRRAGRHVTETTPFGTFFMCGSDVDRFDVNPPGAATVTVEIAADPDIEAVVRHVGLDPSGDPVPVTVDDVVNGTARTFSWTVADFRGSFDVTLSRPQPASDDGDYRARVVVLPTTPDNASCDAATPVLAAETQTAIEGSTYGAASGMTGICNGDDAVAAAGRGGEVFYALDVADQTNLQLSLTGLDGFEGTVSLFRAPAAACPADLNELEPVGFDGAVLAPADRALGACAKARLRAGPLAAGSYLAVVEGLAERTTPNNSTLRVEVGPFTLASQVFPDGFPPSGACAAATAITLPEPGATLDVPLAAADPVGELAGSCGGNGRESVVAFTSDTTVEVTARTEPGGGDSVVYVRRGSCDGGAELACNDDIDPPSRESAVTFTAEAGVPFFVVVDAFLADTDVSLGNTLHVTVAP